MSLSRRHVVLGLTVALAGCAGVRQSRLNPFNWFRKSEPRETIVLPKEGSDPRGLVETVLSMQQVRGERTAMFRTSKVTQDLVAELRRAQAEAEITCF